MKIIKWFSDLSREFGRPVYWVGWPNSGTQKTF